MSLCFGLLPGPATSETTDDASEAPRVLQIGDTALDLQLDGENFEIGTAAIEGWIEQSARAVRTYYGRLPVRRVRIQVVPRGGRGVRGGSTYGRRSVPLIRVFVGRRVTPRQLREDWVMVHELVHLAFPALADRHDWLTEGLATYVESIARVQAGLLTEEQAWAGLWNGFPNGLPRRGDRGLDHTPTWGRTYWGGALFCLLADVEYRKRTQNQAGLQDALRAVVEAGGSIAEAWPIQRALRTGDERAGAPVLSELYESMRATPVATDLDALAEQLGLRVDGRTVHFDESAPLSELRRALTRSPEPPSVAE